MMDILEVYERPYNPDFPVVCFDEKSKQLLQDKRTAIAVKPGRIKKQDYEYQRNGTVNLFVAVEPLAGRRRVRVTKRRTKSHFAREIRQLVTKDYQEAKRVILVMDNLNTHREESLVKELGKREARKILGKIEWHFTPKHASWLNMAEIEISVLSSQCLKRRIPAFQEMQKQVAAWVRDRNRRRSGINWTFTRKEAFQKFKLNTNNN